MSAARNPASAARSGSPPRCRVRKPRKPGKRVAIGFDRVGRGVALLLATSPGRRCARPRRSCRTGRIAAPGVGSGRRSGLGWVLSCADAPASPSDRSVSRHGHPEAGSGVWPVIPHGAMLDAAVVPERDRILPPAEPALEQRVLRVIIEIGQDGRALVPRHAEQALGKASVDVERFRPVTGWVRMTGCSARG